MWKTSWTATYPLTVKLTPDHAALALKTSSPPSTAPMLAAMQKIWPTAVVTAGRCEILAGFVIGDLFGSRPWKVLFFLFSFVLGGYTGFTVQVCYTFQCSKLNYLLGHSVCVVVASEFTFFNWGFDCQNWKEDYITFGIISMWSFGKTWGGYYRGTSWFYWFDFTDGPHQVYDLYSWISMKQ